MKRSSDIALNGSAKNHDNSKLVVKMKEEDVTNTRKQPLIRIQRLNQKQQNMTAVDTHGVKDSKDDAINKLRQIRFK